MTIIPDGILAAAEREKEFHPTRPGGKAITAWERRAVTLEATIEVVNQHDTELSNLTAIAAAHQALLEAIKSRPF